MSTFSRTMVRNALSLFFAMQFLVWQTQAGADDDQAECDPGEDPDPIPFVINGGFLLLILAVVISLWALALVCEEYFVPSLQVLCKRGKVPDSVAGMSSFLAAVDFHINRSCLYFFP